MNWNKGLTKETSESVKKYSDKLKAKYKSGELIGSFKGKHHSLETRQKQSLKACERNNGFVKTKYYEVFCPYESKNVKVQGSYELAYVNYLNKNNINWVRNKTINLKYKLNEDDYIHTYYPDFYLPNTNEYIEIKGYWWKSEDGRVDDKRKMNKVIEYNEDKKIIILMFEDLKRLKVL